MMAAGEQRGLLRILADMIRGTFAFSGRSRRTDGLVWYLVTLLVFASAYSIYERGIETAAATIFLVLVLLLALLPFAGWSVRRLHDCNQPGWWALMLPVPLLRVWSEQADGAMVLLGSIPWLMLLFWPPTRGNNRFGADPRASLIVGQDDAAMVERGEVR